MNEDNSWLLLAVRNLGSCFASPILLLLHNDTTKYQTLISIIRQAPSVIHLQETQKILVNNQYKDPERSIATGSVKTQAIARPRIVLHCNPDLLAVIAPATPDDST